MTNEQLIRNTLKQLELSDNTQEQIDSLNRKLDRLVNSDKNGRQLRHG